ncbi:MAG: hypothetical protein EOO18_11185, partial [Chryseobacterium sp.]
MKMLSKKPVFVLMLTMSTASFYFAQSTQDTLSKDTSIDEVVLTGVADIAKDRKTPVAVSTIKEAQIQEKLGNQEFPEILNTTPSVYATKGGGGFGDSKMKIRGFEQENIAVMVNGMPVNDMENGAVYWSNWLGLSDVTSFMQVQRGLGSSKLAIASVGGTVNIQTRAADKKEGAIVSVGVGNDDYHKSLFAYNTGKSEKGWASSFLLSRTAGSMYANGTEFEGYNYYFALGYKKPGGKHDFQFTITGAPQWHNQRSSYVPISNAVLYNPDKDGTPNIKYNSDWGYRNGEEFSNRVNYYHKPVMSLNWDWKMSEKSKLKTQIKSQGEQLKLLQEENIVMKRPTTASSSVKKIKDIKAQRETLYSREKDTFERVSFEGMQTTKSANSVMFENIKQIQTQMDQNKLHNLQTKQDLKEFRRKTEQEREKELTSKQKDLMLSRLTIQVEERDREMHNMRRVIQQSEKNEKSLLEE